MYAWFNTTVGLQTETSPAAALCDGTLVSQLDEDGRTSELDTLAAAACSHSVVRGRLPGSTIVEKKV